MLISPGFRENNLLLLNMADGGCKLVRCIPEDQQG